MYSIKAIFDGNSFKPSQPIPFKENYEVVITFIEPIKPENKKKRSELVGLLKDKVWMSEDFNAPIEEMREYME